MSEQNELIYTVLGSCISACVRDTVRRVGGMNHFMLPLERSPREAWGSAVSAATRYGNVAMERLINDVLKAGGQRSHLEFKLVGGGRVLAAMTDIGAANIEFVRTYLRTEGFHAAAEDLGDIHPRKVQYWPSTGRLRVKKLPGPSHHLITERERSYATEVKGEQSGGDVELF